MPLGFTLAAIAVGLLIAITHALTVFSKRGGVLFVIMGVILHTALFPIFFFGGAKLEIVALSMMLSLFVYVSLSFIRYNAKRTKEGGEE